MKVQKISFVVFILLAGSLLVCSGLASATKIELKNGALYEGEVLDEDDQTIYMESSRGIFTVKKDRVLAIDGKKIEFQTSTGAASVGIPTKKKMSQSVKEIVAQVGNGKLTRSEYEVYWVRAAKEQGVSPASLPEEFKGQVLMQAVEDELIFQEALAHQIHREETIYGNIVQGYRAVKTIGDIHPQNFSETDIRGYYNTNLNKFKLPLRINFKYIRFPVGLSQSSIRRVWREVCENADDYDSWQELGWVEEGSDFGVEFSDEAMEQIYSLKRGDVSDLIGDEFGIQYIFYALDLERSRLVSFEQARDRVVQEMIKAKHKVADDRFMDSVRSESFGLSDDEALFQKAIAERRHRGWNVKQMIINTYLQKNKVTREEAIPKLKKKHRITLF